MKNRRHTPEQVIRKLAEGGKVGRRKGSEGGRPVLGDHRLDLASVAKTGRRDQCRRRQRLKELERENIRLKKIVAELPVPPGDRGAGRGHVPHPAHVIWALDFQFDQTADGRMLKLLNVIDECTRECLAIEVARSIDADGGGRLP